MKNVDKDFIKELIKDKNNIIGKQLIIDIVIKYVEEEEYKFGEEKEERIQN